MSPPDSTRLDEAKTAPVEQPPSKGPEPARRTAVVLFVIVAAISGLSIWYLFQGQPLVVQGEADATRIDIAARVDGHVLERPANRGDNVAAGQLLLAIDNPELVAKLNEAHAAEAVAEANLANVLAGVRKEEIAQREANVAASQASLALAQQEYSRTKQLSEHDFASQQKLQQQTASLDVAKSTLEQAKAARDEAVAGATREQRAIALAGIARAQANVHTLEAQVAELQVKAPISGQVYQIGSELGEYVSPGVPLLSLVDLSDVWFRFDLREDLAKGLKVGDTFNLRVPALADRLVAVKVKTVAPKGEYAGWRATRATGDFDLRTFEVRAYPSEPLPSLRPGMSAYVEWRGAER